MKKIDDVYKVEYAVCEVLEQAVNDFRKETTLTQGLKEEGWHFLGQEAKRLQANVHETVDKVMNNID